MQVRGTKGCSQAFRCWNLQANLVFTIQKNSFCTSSHMSRHILIRGSRSRSYPPFSTDIFQILVKVLLIIHTHEICALQASPNGPWEVVLEERFPLLLSKSSCASNNRHQAHWQVHLLEFNHLESWLANQVGGQPKKGVPEIMNLASPHGNICQFFRFHESHWWTVIWGKVPGSHEACIGSTKCIGWQIPSMPHLSRYDTRSLQEKCLSTR